jgi:hypothetical protein
MQYAERKNRNLVYGMNTRRHRFISSVASPVRWDGKAAEQTTSFQRKNASPMDLLSMA